MAAWPVASSLRVGGLQTFELIEHRNKRIQMYVYIKMYIFIYTYTHIYTCTHLVFDVHMFICIWEVLLITVPVRVRVIWVSYFLGPDQGTLI